MRQLVTTGRLDWQHAGSARGADLSAALLESSTALPGVLEIFNMQIQGAVDLSGISLPSVLHFVACTFDGPLMLDLARMRGLIIERSSLRSGLDLSLCHIEGDLAIIDTCIEGGLNTRSYPTLLSQPASDDGGAQCQLALRGAHIGGDILLAACTIGNEDHQSSRAIHGRNLEAAGNLTLTNCHIWGETGFPSSKVGGELTVRGGRYIRSGNWAFRISGTSISKSVFFVEYEDPVTHVRRGPHIEGSLQMNGIKVSDLLRLSGLDVTSGTTEHDLGGQWSVALRGSTAGGAVTIEKNSRLQNGLTIDGSRFGGQFNCRAVLCAGESRAALSADGVKVTGTFALGSDKTVSGAVSILRSQLGSDLHFDNLCLAGDAATESGGIDLTGTHVQGSLLGAGLVANRPCRFTGLSVERDIDLRGALLFGGNVPSLRTAGHPAENKADERNPVWAIFADALVVGGTVDFSRCRFLGGIWLRGATLGGRLDLSDARVLNQGRAAICVSLARIGGTVRADRLVALGLVEMNRSKIDGRLTLEGAVLLWCGSWSANRRGSALEVISAFVGGGIWLNWRSAQPFVDLIDTKTPTLADVPEQWPAFGMDWAGFKYERLAASNNSTTPVQSSEKQIGYLREQSPFDLGVYQHAAGLFRSHGYAREADSLLVAGRREARGKRLTSAEEHPPLARLGAAWDWLFEKTVKYGLRPSRALVGMVALIGLVWVSVAFGYSARDSSFRSVSQESTVYAPSGSMGNQSFYADASTSIKGCGDGRVRCFTPHLFAIDTVVPILDLGQSQTWYINPAGLGGWFLQLWIAVATILGWVLSTLFALSFSRLGERQQ